MSGIESILKRFYEVNGSNPLTSASVQKSNVIASMLYKVQDITQPANYNSLVERMLSILKQMSNLQLTVFSESLTSTSMSQALEPIPSPPRLDIPRSEPVKYAASRGYTPIETLIQRIIRRLRLRRRPLGEVEQLPVVEPFTEQEPVPEVKQPEVKQPKVEESKIKQFELKQPEVKEPEIKESGVKEPEEKVPEKRPEEKFEESPRTPRQISWPQYSSKVSQSIPYVQTSYGKKPDVITSEVEPSIQLDVPSMKPEVFEIPEIPIPLVPEDFEAPLTLAIPPSPLEEIKSRASWVGMLGSVFAENAAFFRRREAPPVQRLLQQMTDIVAKAPQITSEVYQAVSRTGIQLLKAPKVLKTIQTPLVLKTIQHSAQQIFRQSIRARQGLVKSAEGSPRMMSELESTQVIERIFDEPDAVSQVLERERESRVAQVRAQVDKVSREASERVSEAYQSGVSSLLPGYMGAAAGHLALAPSMGKMSTVEMTELSEKMASLSSHQEVFKESARHVTSSNPFQQFLLVTQRLNEMVGDADGLGFLGDTIGELASSIPYYGQPSSPAMMQVSRQMEELATAAQASKVASIFTELVDTQIRTEQLMGPPIEGVVSSIMDAPVGADALDRIILGPPSGYPSLKLHEVIPVIQRMALSPVRTPEQVSRPRPTFERQKPAEFREEQRIDDIDMKDLEKKIARILKEEARRYGVY